MAESANSQVEAPRCAPPDPHRIRPRPHFTARLRCPLICGPQATYGYIGRITPPDAAATYGTC